VNFAKVNRIEEEAALLAEPLLAESSEVDEFSAQLLESLNTRNRMETTSTTGGSTDNNNFSNNMPSTIMAGCHNNPIVRGTIAWCLRIRTLADILPPMLQYVVASGKMSVIFFLGGQLVIFVLWLPFWLISFVLSELGLYLIFVCAIFLVGRAIIRMIAFPGSSHRVSKEIEKEFVKYSVRIITSSADSIIDLAAAVQGTHGGNEHEIPMLWKRAKSYSDRVLGVYFEVLQYTLQDRVESGPSDLNKYGNNNLKGDIGNLSGLTFRAKEDGRTLLNQLGNVLIQIDSLKDEAKPILENLTGGGPSDSTRKAASSLMTTATELKNFVESLKPIAAGDTSIMNDESDSENFSVDEVRRRFDEEQNSSGSFMDTIRVGLASIMPMLDPPLHASVFGFDVLRGCLLSRYRGARQLWVQRPGGGEIDCLYIPAKPTASSLVAATTANGMITSCNSKAVLYCNPNAGLIEVATGMSLAGGNVASDTDGVLNDNCWADFYTNSGFDIYLFNYAGFGRSYGGGFCGMCKRVNNDEIYVPGAWGRIKRICTSTFCGFSPTPDSLRADGFAVSNHIISQMGVESLIIHGESIGGVAASSAARKLTGDILLKEKVSLLICDRTFCNLEAVAQRLVGGWSGYAIRMLAPFWPTDVVGDFLAATCPKVVANDAADAIIADSSSLKSGISFWKEIKRSASSTKGIGWMMDAPLHYRMAEWENVCVTDSRYVPPPRVTGTTAPLWPADKHISIEESFHFAACAKRIGKLASNEKKRFAAMLSSDMNATERGMADSCQSPLYLVWKYLGCCEGLCGSALGITVKGGFDTTVSWLSSLLTFGGQTVVEGIEHRHKWSDEEAYSKLHELGQIEVSDFDCRPPGYETQESESVVHPKPIPEVLEAMRKIIEDNPNDELLNSVSHEVLFVIGTLEYVMARLSTPATLEASWKSRHLNANGSMAEGSFMNLHCGHNNPYTDAERKRLKAVLLQVT